MPFTEVDATWANAPDAASEPVYDAADLRRADTSMFAGNGTDNIGVRGGIAQQATNTLAVTVNGSDTVTVQAGAAVIPGNAVTGTGAYRTALPASQTENLPARDATNPRIDLVVLRMQDIDVVGSHTSRKAKPQIIAGVPAGSPSAPALPTMAIELARINVPASGGGAATVDSTKRTFAAALGAVLPVTTVTELPAAAAPWQLARALDTGILYERTATAWRAISPDRFGSGVVAVFGTNPPAGTPKVRLDGSASVTTDSGGFAMITMAGGPFANGITASQVTVDGTATAVTAVARTSTSSLSQLQVKVFAADGSPLASTAVRINYAVTGW